MAKGLRLANLAVETFQKGAGKKHEDKESAKKEAKEEASCKKCPHCKKPLK